MQMFREIIENLDVHHPIPLPLFPDSGNPAQLNSTVKNSCPLFYDKKSPAADCGKSAAGDFPFHGPNTAQPSNPAVLHLGNALVYSSHHD